MGCASSKHLKKQAYEDGWTSPPRKSHHRRSKTFNNNDTSVGLYHRDLLAFTSGSIALHSSNSAQDLKPTNAGGGIYSLNLMYDKLRGLESAESVPKSWNEVIETLKPGLEKSISSPARGRKIGSADLAKAEAPETIDIRDLMSGLDDETTSRGLSPSKNALVSKKPFVSKQQKQYEKAMSFHTVEELDARFAKAKTGFAKDAAQNSPILAHQETIKQQDRFEKENAKPPRSENLRKETSISSKAAMVVRSPQISSHRNNSYLSQPVLKENKSTTKDIVDNRFLSRDVLVDSNPGISPAPVVRYASSRGKVKLTLNLEYQNCFSTELSSRPTASNPTRSLAKRNNSDVLTEPTSPLFDPDLLESYEKALECVSEDDWNSMHTTDDIHQNTLDTGSTDAAKQAIVPNSADIRKLLYDPFERFEEKCPPGGDKSVVLYTTTLRGIRKTFEDCNNAREILKSFGLSIDERDVSMHLEFRNELRELMGKVVCVPRMFIKGRYIGGAEEVAKFHEDGRLSELLQGLPKEMNGGNCDGCGGVRFVPCLECSGSCKLVDEDKKIIRCPDCNENGLIQCPICS